MHGEDIGAAVVRIGERDHDPHLAAQCRIVDVAEKMSASAGDLWHPRQRRVGT
jgi:hypothetical protein